MEINWLGHACFRLKGRDSVVVLDPCPRSTGYNIGKQQAQIVTVSHDAPDHSYLEAISGTPKVINAPGEYEIGGVLITGVRTWRDDKRGTERGKNTTFVIEVDEVRICHLGDLGHVPTQQQGETLTDIDVLLVPVGGHGTIDAATASEIISQIEPKVVVPMHYATEASTVPLDPLDKFIKQMGVSESPPQAKLSLTRANLPISTQVVILDYKR
jgi:L-ascorbate metabolism protein UlaG (beta-lactamase superfamily)